MYEHRLRREKAEKYIFDLCKQLNIQAGPNSFVNVQHEIDFAIKHGRADVLQSIFDSSDRFLNSPMSIGMGGNVPGLKVEMASNYGNHKSSINNHGLIEAPEISFSKEITFYRKEAVIAFNNDDLSNFARCYRAFLQSSVSLVECFIHRYVCHIRALIASTKEYVNTETLDSRRSIEDRLDAWMQTFATHRMEEFKSSKSRSKFIELKMQRNSLVHPSQPTIPYEVRNVVKYLNFVQDGVGGLLSDLRRFSGYNENIGFIRQVKTEPEIRIIKNHR
jgi:hypothetical protein